MAKNDSSTATADRRETYPTKSQSSESTQDQGKGGKFRLIRGKHSTGSKLLGTRKVYKAEFIPKEGGAPGEGDWKCPVIQSKTDLTLLNGHTPATIKFERVE